MSMLKVLDKENTILNTFVAELRNVEVQNDRMRFRRNLERIGEIMAYELSKTLKYSKQTVQTPLGECDIMLPEEDIVLATILRSGLPFHQGFLNYFDKADCAFISAYRQYNKDGSYSIELEYVSTPNIDGKVLVIIDPMLATGASTVKAYDAMVEGGGEPKHTHIVSVVASQSGVCEIVKHLTAKSATIWTAALDHELTAKSYIVPGIGDTGDLAYGEKL